jgi:PDZ domain-containing protein
VVTRTLSPLRLALAGLALLGVVFVVLWQVQSSDFLLLPDRAHPAAPIVRVQGGHDPRGPGGIYFVDVLEERASLLDKLFHWVHKGASLVPASEILPPGTNDKAAHRIDLSLMRTSQQVAAAVALKALGYHVVSRPRGVAFGETVRGTDAARRLEPGDVITSVDGRRVRTVPQLVASVRGRRVGETVTVGLIRGDKRLTVPIRLTRLTNPVRPGLGIGDPQDITTLQVPLHVQIASGDIGGPSAGLPFALEVAAELGRNVTHGRRVVATGEIHPDGTVSAIGGVKQKTYGARLAHADVFLVPAGDNYREALRYADGLRIIPVRNFRQALRALKTLPPKR